MKTQEHILWTDWTEVCPEIKPADKSDIRFYLQKTEICMKRNHEG